MSEATNITPADYEKHHDSPPDEKRSRELFLACNGNRANILAWNAMRLAIRGGDSDWRPRLSSKGDVLASSGVYWFEVRNGDTIGIDLGLARLRHADLTGAQLDHATLRGAQLDHATLTEAKLNHADLSFARLDHARLWGVELSYAKVAHAKLNHADLMYAELGGSILEGCDLSDANVIDVTYDRSELDGRCRGVRAATCYGHPLFKRHVQDQDFIDTLARSLRHERESLSRRAKGPPRDFSLNLLGKRFKNLWARCRFNIWRWSDYGRSFGRVFLFSFVVVALFGFIFSYGRSAIDGSGMLHYSDTTPNSWLTPFYYSIVTFTTLGFGDVTPCTTVGQIVVILEVIFGYITLGLLVSILANRFARRS